MNKQFASEIVDRVKISDVFSRYGYKVDRAGYINCPFHKEKSASLKAYKNDTKYHCFGCGVTGSVIDFVMKLHNLSFNQTIIMLNHDFGLNLPIGEKISLRQKREMIKLEKERVRKKQTVELLKQQKEDYYWKVFDEWKRFDDNMRTYKPKSASEELHPLFIEALKKITHQEYLLDLAEFERAVKL